MAEDATWVEVRDEPRHRRRFETDLVRVYDVEIPPGDTTLYHRHTEDTFYVAVNEATVRDRTWGEEGERTGTAPAKGANGTLGKSSELLLSSSAEVATARAHD